MIARALMLSVFAFFTGCAGSPFASNPNSLPEIALIEDDTRIDRSVRVRPGTYEVTDVAGDGVFQIVADDVVLDLSGVILVGSSPAADPDSYRGIGVRANGVSGVTIRHGSIRGFRVGIEVIGGRGHTILGSDLSENFRQRLRSTPDTENAEDWLWPHENDDDQWATRYGAALHLKEVAESRVESVRVRRGQNGIILSRCRGVEVHRNDCSFLSGWGLAMWRTVDCAVTENRFDWCVRGYSHGVYARGQDSAGILVFEQCSRNLFRGNSVTHGGDGFFLYCGNETLRETGLGGSNENSLIGNDFSHAVMHGIEATFSGGNRFEANTLHGCTNGIWAGYSYDTWIGGNDIRSSVLAGVAIEHGQGNTILGNWFAENPIGISLWWDEDPDLVASAFGKRHSSESTGNRIFKNRFEGDRFEGDQVAISLRDALATEISPLDDYHLGSPPHFCRNLRRSGKGEVLLISSADETALAKVLPRDPPRRGAAFLPEDAPRGRSRIFIDEWGPYDFEGVRAWPTVIEGVAAARIHILGPDLPYRIDAISGAVEVEPRTGILPATVRVSPRAGGAGVIPFTFVALTDDGEIMVRGSLLALPWTVEYRVWEPIGPGEPPRDWSVVRTSAPIHVERRNDLDLQFGAGAPAKGMPADHFATVATSSFSVPEGRYRVRIVSDDGVRVTLDGETIHEDWTWHAPREASIEITLASGEHQLEVEHFEIDGYAVLRVVLIPLDPDPS